MAAAESGELAEADRAARRAYRDFAAAGDDWGRGLSLVVRGVVARGLAEPAHAIDLLSHADAYGQKSGHPLLIGMARTIRGFVSLEQGDGRAAEADAQTVLDLVEARDVLESARVGPRVLFALARRAQGDLDTALSVLGPVAEAPSGPALLFARRHAIAAYASVLLSAGRAEEALKWARCAQTTPAEDVRSRVYAARTLASALAATGQVEEARVVAAAAVHEAYATQQVSERAAADAVRERVNRETVGLS